VNDRARWRRYSDMQTSYLAYGMQLRCSFALPGMTPQEADGLPELSLRMATPTDVSRLWSGPREPAWRGRLGDGLELTLERGGGGDVLFSYGDRARFLLRAQSGMLPQSGTLLCAPAHGGAPAQEVAAPAQGHASAQEGLDWQRVLCTKVLAAISVILGYEALHAGVVASPSGVVALAGSSGAGKSTLVLELLKRGWQLFADDALIIESVEGEVRAHPGTPHMNLDVDLPDGIDPQMLGQTLGVLAGERWLAAHASVGDPRPVRMVCQLERRLGFRLETAWLPANALLLAPFRLGLQGDRERERRRFDVYADLMKSARLMRLTAGLEHSPAQIAQALERALDGERELASGGVA